MYCHHSEIEKNLFWYGVEHYVECESLRLWTTLCAQATVIFDVGAFSGLYALAEKASNPSSHVVAFEPTTFGYARLLRNNALNDFDIVAENLGVSNITGQTTIEKVYQENKLVNAVRLDDYMLTKHLSRIDLVKIDVELHEPEVLSGFLNSIGKFRPTMIIECTSVYTGKPIHEILAPFDYLYFDIDERTGPVAVETLTGSSDYNYLVCTRDVAETLGLM
jgi:FkbM family methyltransferase